MPDTPAGAAKTGASKQRTPAEASAPPEPEPAAAEPAPAAESAAEPAEPDTSGWYRNDAATAVTVTPHGAPSAYLRPGAAAWFPADPASPFLVACDGPTDIEAGPGPAETETEA